MSDELRDLIERNWKESSKTQRELFLNYFALIQEESKRQNLTRLESPQEFYWGHLNDVRELVENVDLKGTGLDLGSGVGVPGIPLAISKPELNLVLTESEVRKAEFLGAATKQLGLDGRVRVFHGRAEDYLKANKVDFIISRAVGTLSKHLNILWACSTWNKLVLFKGPRWSQEWAEVQATNKWRDKVRVESEYSYTEPFKNRDLRIVSVLRGTLKTP